MGYTCKLILENYKLKTVQILLSLYCMSWVSLFLSQSHTGIRSYSFGLFLWILTWVTWRTIPILSFLQTNHNCSSGLKDQEKGKVTVLIGVHLTLRNTINFIHIDTSNSIILRYPSCLVSILAHEFCRRVLIPLVERNNWYEIIFLQVIFLAMLVQLLKKLPNRWSLCMWKFEWVKINLHRDTFFIYLWEKSFEFFLVG